MAELTCLRRLLQVFSFKTILGVDDNFDASYVFKIFVQVIQVFCKFLMLLPTLLELY